MWLLSESEGIRVQDDGQPTQREAHVAASEKDMQIGDPGEPPHAVCSCSPAPLARRPLRCPVDGDHYRLGAISGKSMVQARPSAKRGRDWRGAIVVRDPQNLVTHRRSIERRTLLRAIASHFSSRRGAAIALEDDEGTQQARANPGFGENSRVIAIADTRGPITDVSKPDVLIWLSTSTTSQKRRWRGYCRCPPERRLLPT